MGSRYVNWVLIGFKSSGKTTVGRSLAAILQWPFYDTDALVCEGSYRDLYREIGEEAFREKERQAVEKLTQVRQAVIATGGGTPGLERLRPTSRFIYLRLSPERLWQRLNQGALPAFLDASNPHQHFLRLFEEREPRYRALADVVIDGE
jgi:shikimate kinase